METETAEGTTQVNEADTAQLPNSPPPTIIDHATLSFPDADIHLISRIDDENERVRFKVHKRVLGVYSSVFYDMLCIANGQEGNATNANGAPEVALDDQASVLEDLLSFMYSHHANVTMPTFHNRPLDACLQLLYLTDKYNITNLRYMLESGLLHQLEEECGETTENLENYGSFTVQRYIDLMAYGESVGNKRIIEVALAMTSYQDEIDLGDLSETAFAGLSDNSQTKFWKHNYLAKTELLTAANQNADKESKEMRRFQNLMSICLKPLQPVEKHQGPSCWLRTALPVWHGMIMKAIFDNNYNVDKQKQAVTISTSLKQADYGECEVCKKTIKARIEEIAKCWSG